MAEVESILKNVLLLLQICLALWQFMKLTPLGALLKGLMGWLLRKFRGLSPTYASLQPSQGRIFRRLNCYVLQAESPSEREVIRGDENNGITLNYLGETIQLVKWGTEGNMLNKGNAMSYYITPPIWQELRTLERVLNIGLVGARAIAQGARERADVARARADEARAQAQESANRAAEWRAHVAAIANYGEKRHGANIARAKAYTRIAEDAVQTERRLSEAANVENERLSRVVADADAAAAAAGVVQTVFLKGQREFWEEVMTGGTMTLEEVLDGIILDNQHVSLPLNDDWLLPVNLLVSEEKLVKILNFFGLFLQTDILKDKFKVKVQWLIAISMSLTIISALLEFSTRVRVCVYTNINAFFCCIAHSICDRLRRSWRRQVYSLGKWVENFKPGNDIQLKIIRGTVHAIIAGSAKVDREGARWVAWLNQIEEDDFMIENVIRCEPIHNSISCKYVRHDKVCEISAPTISVFYVKCNTRDEFIRITTLVTWMARNCCGSLISCGPNNEVCCGLIPCSPNNEVRVRRFKESVLYYVKSGLPRIYELELANVVVV